MSDNELLLAIHEQCEALQGVIGIHFNKPCKEIKKEVLLLTSLLEDYLVKHP